ncbi:MULTISPECIES: hypothetical protein [Pirellulaceae]|nr:MULTISPECIES: hypothetical protein [Pirellulaceae]
MDKDSLTDIQRDAIRFYIASRHNDITPAFVFRFYLVGVVYLAVIFILLSALAWFLVPADAVISVRISLVAVFAAMFSTLVLWFLWKSHASVEHWLMLRSIIDWNAVARLMDDDNIDDSIRDERS